MLDENTLIIFTTSPTGLGHIRVTKALMQGAPSHIPQYTLGIQDPAIESIYRLMSTNHILREVMEFFQTNQKAEILQAYLFQRYEKRNIQSTLQEIDKILVKYPKVQKIQIISTHAQLARRIQVILAQHLLPLPTQHAVVVTDDSPQRLWAVPSQVIFVPSEYTRKQIAQIMRVTQNIQVVPYPIDPILTQPLSDYDYLNRRKQVDPDLPDTLHVCIPISGAAVQLDFFESIIEHYCAHPQHSTQGQLKKIHFHIVAKDSPYSHNFLIRIRTCKHVTCHIGQSNEETINLYNALFQNPTRRPAIEITKPSEQAFKVLTPPQTIGGVTLLLTKPIGRQEYDNLDYLKREGFIPTRALELADTPNEAISQIDNLIQRRILYKQASEKTITQNDGVAQIWNYLLQYKEKPTI